MHFGKFQKVVIRKSKLYTSGLGIHGVVVDRHFNQIVAQDASFTGYQFVMDPIFEYKSGASQVKHNEYKCITFDTNNYIRLIVQLLH